jgi:hypothetical protein
MLDEEREEEEDNDDDDDNRLWVDEMNEGEKGDDEESFR